jgi:cytochrome c-type biogenesis protein
MSGVGQLVTSGPLILALPVAAAAGAVTFLSPCCLPLVPGYLSFVTGMAGVGGSSATAVTPGDPPGSVPPDGSGVAVAAPPLAATATVPPRGRVVAGTALFVLGFSVVFVAYGAALGGLGHLLIGHARLLTQILGGLTIVLGLLFAGVLDRFSFAGRIVRPAARPKAGLAGAPLLGVMFGLGWTPCIGPTLTAVMTMSVTTGTAAKGAFLAFVYALGLGIPFLIAAFAVQRGLRAFGFARRHARLIMQVGGAMLVLVGAAQVTGVWTDAIGSLQHWIAGYPAPL